MRTVNKFILRKRIIQFHTTIKITVIRLLGRNYLQIFKIKILSYIPLPTTKTKMN